MLITTLHETVFEYAQPIRGTWTQARLWPATDEHQTCREFSLSVDPMQPLHESCDYYKNRVLTFNIWPPHLRVVVSARSVVETHRKPFQPQPLEDFENHKAQYEYSQWGGPIEKIPPVENFARDCGLFHTDACAPWWESASVFSRCQSLCAAIHHNFEYSEEATDVHTPIGEVFETRRGVCQDFAHIFIACCRSAGIAARYVSGYLVTGRALSAEGSPASHAWAEALIPNFGWCAFDPTNNLLPDDCYVKIAAGRDYDEASPTRGLYVGKNVECHLRVRVHSLLESELATTNASTQAMRLVG
jgi:transglutaminase-like putative cysteine protease